MYAFQISEPDPHPMMQAFNAPTPEKYVQLVLRKVKSRCVHQHNKLCLHSVGVNVKEFLITCRTLPKIITDHKGQNWEIISGHSAVLLALSQC